MKDIDKLLVKNNSKIREAINAIDEGGIGIVFIVNSTNQVIGVVTDGDFRRAVLKGIKLDEDVNLIINKNFISLEKTASEKLIINAFLNNRIDQLPILSNGQLIDVLPRENYNLEGKVILPEKSLNIPVVIMAGGKGTRMAPFTNILPKPLIPIGNRSMLEVIMDEYNKYGFNNFIISVNYKGGLIKAYLADIDHNYNISYLDEDKFLGTAGALNLLNITYDTPIIVSNCDILIKDDYLGILDFHQNGDYDLTLVAAMTHHQVPYGVCTIKNGGELDKISEKPQYDYLVNSGMYILKSSILSLIPKDEFFHITHLMEKIKNNGGKVGVYPITEKSWIDIGQWEEYRKSVAFF